MAKSTPFFQHHLVLKILVLLLFSNAALAKTSGFDVITMKNGDVHQGTVAIESLELKTSFGTIVVPYHQLSLLSINKKQDSFHQAQLTTKEGEIINGQLSIDELTIFRVLDVTLPLPVADITSVSFASRDIPSVPAHQSPDILKTTMGDQLLVTIAPTDIGLLLEESPKTIHAKEIRYLDSVFTEDDEQPRIQLTLRDNKILQGTTTLKAIQFTSHYGQNLSIAMEQLSELRYGANSKNLKPDFTYRWQNKPVPLFQDRMVDGSMGPEMINIPAGQFMRGDSQGDDDEKPTTSVTINAFAIGALEVTFDEYDLFCKSTRREMPDDADWGRGNRPVINVTWTDAIAYTDWLSKRTGKSYRLPSDAEWEYAARAGTQGKYWWGNKTGIAKANCEGCQSLWDGYQTAPVGKFFANPFGLHDTAGNVFEWVADCWHNKFAEAPSNGSPIEKQGCGKRTIRGGAWSFPPKEIRSANRWRDFPSRRSDDTGFRVARDLE